MTSALPNQPLKFKSNLECLHRFLHKTKTAIANLIHESNFDCTAYFAKHYLQSFIRSKKQEDIFTDTLPSFLYLSLRFLSKRTGTTHQGWSQAEPCHSLVAWQGGESSWYPSQGHKRSHWPRPIAWLAPLLMNSFVLFQQAPLLKPYTCGNIKNSNYEQYDYKSWKVEFI